jgi:hypothetical protein
MELRVLHTISMVGTRRQRPTARRGIVRLKYDGTRAETRFRL